MTTREEQLLNKTIVLYEGEPNSWNPIGHEPDHVKLFDEPRLRTCRDRPGGHDTAWAWQRFRNAANFGNTLFTVISLHLERNTRPGRKRVRAPMARVTKALKMYNVLFRPIAIHGESSSRPDLQFRNIATIFFHWQLPSLYSQAVACFASIRRQQQVYDDRRFVPKKCLQGTKNVLPKLFAGRIWLTVRQPSFVLQMGRQELFQNFLWYRNVPCSILKRVQVDDQTNL